MLHIYLMVIFFILNSKEDAQPWKVVDWPCGLTLWGWLWHYLADSGPVDDMLSGHISALKTIKWEQKQFWLSKQNKDNNKDLMKLTKLLIKLFNTLIMTFFTFMGSKAVATFMVKKEPSNWVFANSWVAALANIWHGQLGSARVS